MTKKRLPTIGVLLICLLLEAGSGWGRSGDSLPLAAGIALNRALYLAEQGKTVEALDVLQSFQEKQNQVIPEVARKKGYSHPYIDYALGNYRLQLFRPAAAVENFLAAVEKQQDFSDAWLGLGKGYYELEEMKPAGAAFLKGYETASEGESRYLYYSAVCYAMAEAYPTAYSLFRRLLAAHPEDMEPAWKESLVQVLLALGKPAEALPHVRELAETYTGEKQRQWREILLYQYMTLNMEDKALAYAHWLTRVDTVEPRWWKALAHLQLQQDRYREGLVAFLAYSFLRPLTPEESELMARLYLVLDIPGEAVEFYEILLKDSLEPDILRQIVRGYLRLYDHQTAMQWIDRGLQRERMPDLLHLKGNLLFEAGRYVEAAAIFDQLSSSGYKPGQSLLMLGYAAWNAEDAERARQAFQQAAEYDQQKQEAQQALEQLAIRSGQ